MRGNPYIWLGRPAVSVRLESRTSRIVLALGMADHVCGSDAKRFRRAGRRCAAAIAMLRDSTTTTAPRASLGEDNVEIIAASLSGAERHSVQVIWRERLQIGPRTSSKRWCQQIDGNTRRTRSGGHRASRLVRYENEEGPAAGSRWSMTRINN